MCGPARFAFHVRAGLGGEFLRSQAVEQAGKRNGDAFQPDARDRPLIAAEHSGELFAFTARRVVGDMHRGCFAGTFRDACRNLSCTFTEIYNYPVLTSTKSGDLYFVAGVIFPLIVMCRCGFAGRAFSGPRGWRGPPHE